MPLIEIDVLPQPATIDLAAIARTLNAEIARALGSRLDAVWTIWRTIDGPYVRGDDVAAGQTHDAFGPIVHIYHHRPPEQMERVVEAVETILARELSIARDNVFVTSRPVEIELPPEATGRSG